MLVAEWGKQFAHRYLRPSRSTTRARDPDPSLWLGDAAALSHALSLYLYNDDMDKVNLLLKKHEDLWSQNPRGFAQLVRFAEGRPGRRVVQQALRDARLQLVRRPRRPVRQGYPRQYACAALQARPR